MNPVQADAWELFIASEGPRSVGGVNSVTLFYDGERWWIMNWMFDATGG